MGVTAIWSQCRGGMGGFSHLPFAGGAAEQPAILMDAFQLLSWAASELEPKKD